MIHHPSSTTSPSSLQPESKTSGPELLSPAGDWESLRAAAANGANAVYFGLSNFNARHRAANFTIEELNQVMTFLHERNVRGYVTLNTLIFSDELNQIIPLIQACCHAGVDAVIVQDLGLAQLIHRIAPGLAIHGSTQMTLTEPLAIDFVKQLGVCRVILARELSLGDITKIARETSVPIEAFVHGALCVAYSGQCLTSEALGGRSANRGQCAQACRLPYELVVDGQLNHIKDIAYLLSPQDLAAYDLLGELLNAGISSFKIEGRLKSAHYVAATTQAYRLALDAAKNNQPISLDKQIQLNLTQSFSRGFTHGYFDGVNHQILVEGRFPKNRGVKVGTVIDTTPQGLLVQLDPAFKGELKPGDGVVFDQGHPEQDEQGGRIYALRPHTPKKPNPKTQTRQVEILFAKGNVQIQAVEKSSLVWRTDDPAMRKKLEQSFSRDLIVHRTKVDFDLLLSTDKTLTLKATLNTEHSSHAKHEQVLQQARKFPLDTAQAKKQLDRLGDTPFELGRVRLLLESPSSANQPWQQVDAFEVMVPASLLNDLRRQTIDQLLKQQSHQKQIQVSQPHALKNWRQEIIEKSRKITEIDGKFPEIALHSPKNNASHPPHFHVLVRTLEQLQTVLDWQEKTNRNSPQNHVIPGDIWCDFEDVKGYRQAIALGKTAGRRIGPATLRIIKPNEYGLLQQLADLEPPAVLIRHLAAMVWFTKHHPNLPRIGDYSLNVANELTADLLFSQGFERLVPSYDLNWDQLKTMLHHIPSGCFELVVHQHMPMFHMEHCVFAHLLSTGKDYHDCGRPCEKHQVSLQDREQVKHPLVADVGCRNTVYNGCAQSAAEYIPRALEIGIRNFRVELLRQDADETRQLLTQYHHVISGQADPKETWRSLRVLNQLGVTRGTLKHPT